MENYAKKAFSKIGFSYLALGITAIIAQILILNIIGPIVPEIFQDQNMLISISAFCTYIVPIPIFLYLMRKVQKVEIIKTNLGLKKFLICFCIALALMYIGNVIGLGITDLIGNFKQSAVSNPVVELISSSSIWINIFLITLIGPIFEELFFRKWLIDRTIRFGPKISILLSGLLFGLFHGNLNQFFYAFLIGSFFAFLYVKTGQIKYPIALHVIINFFGSVLSLFLVNVTDFNTMSPDVLIAMLFSFAIFVIVVLGILFLLLNYKKFTTLKNYIKKPIKTSIINWGMLFFIAFYIFEIIQATI